ncbi:hypothetical protein [Paraburkholderia sp. SIMBA_054]|uniref:hypothetical protein n=1 Tax=Paraburkholderia sp. SIMBA_054 TaxID=3085795 RepID=UPI00397DE76B
MKLQHHAPQQQTSLEENERLRSGFAGDERIFLFYNLKDARYRLATRWAWLTSFDNVWDACDAFEALELAEGDVRVLARWSRKEIARVPRTRFGRDAGSMKRINYLVNSIERRAAGLRPQPCGRKGSVERWIPARHSSC